MVKRYSVTQARAGLSRLVKEVQQGARVELTRGGKLVAVMVAAEDSERLPTNESRGFWAAYQEFRRRLELANIEIDPDEIWGDVRDRSPGRDFEW